MMQSRCCINSRNCRFRKNLSLEIFKSNSSNRLHHVKFEILMDCQHTKVDILHVDRISYPATFKNNLVLEKLLAKQIATGWVYNLIILNVVTISWKENVMTIKDNLAEYIVYVDVSSVSPTIYPPQQVVWPVVLSLFKHHYGIYLI